MSKWIIILFLIFFMITNIPAGKKKIIEVYYLDNTVDTLYVDNYDDSLIQIEIELKDGKRLIIPKLSVKKFIIDEK